MAARNVPLRPLAVAAASSIVAAVTIGFLYHGRALLIPLAIAILIWHLINALAGFYHRLTPGKRRLPGWFSYMGALLTIFGALTIMVELIRDNVAEVSLAAPGYEASLRDLLNTMYDLVGLKSAPSFAQIIEQISVGSVVTAVAGTLGGLAGSAGIVVVYVIFLLLEQSIFERKLRALLADPGRAERLHRLLARIAAQIEGYLWVKTLTSLLAGMVSFAIMWAVGVDFAAFWALMIFLLNFIPVNVTQFASGMGDHELQTTYTDQVLQNADQFDYVLFGPTELSLQADNVKRLIDHPGLKVVVLNYDQRPRPGATSSRWPTPASPISLAR